MADDAGGARRRKSLVAGEARRDRITHSRQTGRVTTAREIGLGSRAAGGMKKFDRDQDGYDEIDQAFAFSPAPANNGSSSDYDLDASGSQSETSVSSSHRSRKSSAGQTNEVFVSTPSSSERSFGGSQQGDDSVDHDEDSEMPSPVTPGTILGADTPMSTSTTASTPASAIVTGKLSFGGALGSPEMDDDDIPSYSPSPGVPTPRTRTPGTAKKAKKGGRRQVEEEEEEDEEDEEDVPVVQTKRGGRRQVEEEEEEDEEVVPVVQTKRAKPQPKAKPKKKAARVRQITSADIHDVEVDMDDSEAPKTAPRNKKKRNEDKWMYIEDKTPMNPTDRERYANNTGGLLKEAKASGLIDEIQQENDDDDSGMRRSKRQRFQPLEHWRNERVNYKRRDSGVGAFMPTIDTSNPVTEPTWYDNAHLKSKAKGQRSRSLNKTLFNDEKKQTRKKENIAPTEEEEVIESSSDDDDNSRVIWDSACEIVDRSGVVMIKDVAKSITMASFEELPYGDSGDGGPRRPNPLGWKMLEEEEFGSGILRLPPKSKKNLECAPQSEVFYIADAAVNGLEVQIHKKKFIVGKGDTFAAPPGNMYSITNLSSKKTAEIFFLLVKQSNVNLGGQ